MIKISRLEHLTALKQTEVLEGLLDVASMSCLARRLEGWMPQNYSMLTHVKTGGKKNSSLRATTFGSFIPNLEIWIQGSGATGHMSSTLIFQIFGR